MRVSVCIAALIATIAVAVNFPYAAWAQARLGTCTPPLARIVSFQGPVDLKSAGADAWRPAALDAPVCAGDMVRTGAEGRAALVFRRTDTILRVDQNTRMRIRQPRVEKRSFIDLILGAVHFFSRTPEGLDVDTPLVNAAVEGTEFFISATGDRALLIVFEGRVLARNDRGSIRLADGQAAEVRPGGAPRSHVVVRPRDAVQWALYYPPVLGAGGAKESGAGEPAAALRRAADLLASGRRAEAEAALSGQPETGGVLALRAVIAVALNRRDRALDLATRAVAASPRSAAARIALSYAQQAKFDLEAARDTLIEAVKQHPNNALAWARLSELWLSQGYSGRALDAAEKAAQLAPGLARANMALGFAYLVRIRPQSAQAAFEKAAAQNSREPFARLGLGLAKIRRGDLVAGRKDIAIAAALDPGNSLIRSYLGKAYFEEGSDITTVADGSGLFDGLPYSRAAREYEIAKELDPNDPTPYLYGASLKQAQNNPVGALKDIQKSIDLNDNRAVYRSRLMLDADRASRGVSLAEVYAELGFEQLALNEASKSLDEDPANHSAHRFLADAYRGRPRHEIARASELLVAQLLQPLSANPVQPQAGIADLNVAPSLIPGLNEFGQLFQRDQVRLRLFGGKGNNGTVTDEVILSGIQGRTAFSFGRYRFDTDGFRINNDLRHEIYNVFAQAALSEDFNVQVELRKRDTEHGDLDLNFDPEDFAAADRRGREQTTARLGFHYSVTPGIDFIGTFSATDRSDPRVLNFPSFAIFTTDEERNGYLAETQILIAEDIGNIKLGANAADIDGKSITTQDFSPCVFGPFCPPNSVRSDRYKSQQRAGYVYGNINWPRDFTWTLGLAYESYEASPIFVKRYNPKAGLRIRLGRAAVRIAYMKTLKRPLVVDQTIEPTQIAGFNQFFDDFGGTQAEHYGAGVDATIFSGLSGGIEVSRRNLNVPVVDQFGDVSLDGRREENASAYLYWAISENWTLTSRFQREYSQRKDTDSPFPSRVETYSVPIGIRYFSREGFAKGLFAMIGPTFVRQEITPSPFSSFEKNEDEFWTVDAAIGYRLPNRRGAIVLEARNLFDQKFLYQDAGFQSVGVNTPRFIPERNIIAKLRLRF